MDLERQEQWQGVSFFLGDKSLLNLDCGKVVELCEKKLNIL